MFKKRKYDEPAHVEVAQTWDNFEPTEEYIRFTACKHCSRTDGMTKTNDICKFCKNNQKGEQTNEQGKKDKH